MVVAEELELRPRTSIEKRPLNKDQHTRINHRNSAHLLRRGALHRRTCPVSAVGSKPCCGFVEDEDACLASDASGQQ
jgi:hypothetical protein